MSGYDAPNTTRTMIAGAPVRKGQLVKLSAGKVIPCSVANEAAHGIAIQEVGLNEEVGIVIQGETTVEVASAAMGVGGVLTPFATDASGRAIPWVAGVKVGFMLEAGIALDANGTATTRRCVIMQII